MDIVYILRNGIESEELRYSLRSLKNLPHDKVWFFGGEPDGLKPDRQVPYIQPGVSKWQKVSRTLEVVCRTKEVSDDFYLFNDDFFVMQPVEEIPPYYDKTLYRRIQKSIKLNNGNKSLYAIELERLRDLLNNEHRKTYNYAVHIPMPVNKKKALEVIGKYKRSPMFRSLYGNYWNIGGEQIDDCKISDNSKPDPDAVFLSTTGRSFASFEVGQYIREKFPEKCEYEL